MRPSQLGRTRQERRKRESHSRRCDVDRRSSGNLEGLADSSWRDGGAGVWAGRSGPGCGRVAPDAQSAAAAAPAERLSDPFRFWQQAAANGHIIPATYAYGISRLSNFCGVRHDHRNADCCDRAVEFVREKLARRDGRNHGSHSRSGARARDSRQADGSCSRATA